LSTGTSDFARHPGIAKRYPGSSVITNRHFMKTLDKFAPSMALTLRATGGVRVGNPANAVRFRGNDGS
jgi:hypothetical protein